MSVYYSWQPYWPILCLISLPIKETSKRWQWSVYDSWHPCRRTLSLISLPTKEYFKQPQQLYQCLIQSLHPCKSSCLSYLSIKETSKRWQWSVYDSWHPCRRTLLFLCPPKNISNSHNSHASVWFNHYIHICLISLPIKETSKRWQWSVYDSWRPSRTLCRITLPTKERS